jgi:hypothetical protein
LLTGLAENDVDLIFNESQGDASDLVEPHAWRH